MYLVADTHSSGRIRYSNSINGAIKRTRRPFKRKGKGHLIYTYTKLCPRLDTQILLNEKILVINLLTSQLKGDSHSSKNDFLLSVSTKFTLESLIWLPLSKPNASRSVCNNTIRLATIHIRGL